MPLDRHAVSPSPDTAEIQYNRLINEKSPYLLQHATNPVDWYPWGDEAFARAKKEDKPVFLSIGYATCHWCHVMAHESFEDADVAALLNKNFISIKVDREERPDIDSIYMSVCQIMTGQGGWPLTVIITPEKKPFFAGTYFPKEGRFGMSGLLDLLLRITARRKRVITASADEIVAALQKSMNQATATGRSYQRRMTNWWCASISAWGIWMLQNSQPRPLSFSCCGSGSVLEPDMHLPWWKKHWMRCAWGEFAIRLEEGFTGIQPT
jgi:uncharacterized protein YyaL (SSP411 family)